MSSSIVLNSDSFAKAADAFRTRCSVPFIVVLAEDNNATDTTPPNLAFKVPETSILSAISKAVHEGFRRFLPEPNNAPLFWLSRATGGREPVAWTMPVGLLAEIVQHEHDLDDTQKPPPPPPPTTTSTTSSNSSRSAFVTNTSVSPTASSSASTSPASAAAATTTSGKSFAQIDVNEFKKPRFILPIKLYANFRLTKRGEIFPFHAAHLNGAQLVAAMGENALHAVKRSVAIMNPETYKTFLGKLNPQDMQALYDLCMMDSVSLTKRTALARFHKDILATIDVRSWPVMIHSMESGRTMTLAIPVQVLNVRKNFNNSNNTYSNNNNNQNEEEKFNVKSDNNNDYEDLDHNNAGSPSSPKVGSPVIVVMGTQGQFIAHSQVKQRKASSTAAAGDGKSNDADNNDDNDDDVAAAAATSTSSSSSLKKSSVAVMTSTNLRPTVFGDLVKALHERMAPEHLDEHKSPASPLAVPTSRTRGSDEDPALDLLRRRMIVGGLPDAPLAETPLRWLMEHLVNADLSLHVLLLPPNFHTE